MMSEATRSLEAIVGTLDLICDGNHPRGFSKIVTWLSTLTEITGQLWGEQAGGARGHTGKPVRLLAVQGGTDSIT